MKPTFQSPATCSRHGARFPKTDYSFRPSISDFGGRSRGEGSSSFRGISAAYFSNEARGHFVTEAGFFALIVLISVVPVTKAISGLFVLMLSAGVL